MNKPHKWAKEIHAWADGAEIEAKSKTSCWWTVENPRWEDNVQYRIKPQPKEPQYLYVYKRPNGEHSFFETAEERGMILLGKIKLEQDE